MKIRAYLRVSTEEQADSGLGLEAQETACRKWAATEGHEMAGVWIDTNVSRSAPLDKRPALFDLLMDFEQGDILLVAKRDRIGGDPYVTASLERDIEQKGGSIASATEGNGDQPVDVLTRRILDAFAEFERQIIRARTRAAMRAKIARGERCGRVPFGQDLAADGVKLIPNPAELETIRIMVKMRSEGGSLRGIATQLNAMGAKTKEGKRGDTRP